MKKILSAHQKRRLQKKKTSNSNGDLILQENYKNNEMQTDINIQLLPKPTSPILIT